MQKVVQDITLPRMAKVHNMLKMWQSSQNLCATQKESHAQNKQMTAVGYILDMQEIVKASRSLFNMMVRRYLNCQKDLLCHQVSLQRTLLADELKY